MHKSEHLITARHYLVLAVTAFAAGIFVFVSFSADIFFSVVLLVAAVFVALGVLLLSRCFSKSSKIRRKKHILLPFFLLLCFFLGIFRVICAEYLTPSHLRQYANKGVWISGTIRSEPIFSTKSFLYRFEFDAVQIGDDYIYPERMILNIPQSRGEGLRRGDEIRCWVKVSEPFRDNDTDFLDYYTHLRGKSIYTIGFTQNANHIALQKPFHPITSIKDFGSFLRNKTINAVDALVPGNEALSAILKGILVGDKSSFSNNLYEVFSRSGLSHLVAVSGMHLSILFSIISLLFYRMHAHKKLAYLFAVPLVILFASSAEFTPSICRSGIMLLMTIAAMLFRQRYNPITALFLSLGIILLITPYALFSKSLILSFSATFGILAYFSNINKLIQYYIPIPRTRFPRINNLSALTKNSLSTSLAISISAFIGTAFFSVLFFQQFSWIQLLTNLWVIPVVTVVFCLGALGCVLYYIAPTFTVAAFYYPLRICLGIIHSTACTFGKKFFSFNFENTTITFAHFSAYLAISYILYMSLRLWSDTHYKKEKRQSPDRL